MSKNFLNFTYFVLLNVYRAQSYRGRRICGPQWRHVAVAVDLAESSGKTNPQHSLQYRMTAGHEVSGRYFIGAQLAVRIFLPLECYMERRNCLMWSTRLWWWYFILWWWYFVMWWWHFIIWWWYFVMWWWYFIMWCWYFVMWCWYFVMLWWYFVMWWWYFVMW